MSAQDQSMPNGEKPDGGASKQKDESADQTAFDTLVAHARREIDDLERADAVDDANNNGANSGGAARLKAIFDAAITEAGAVKDEAAHKIQAGAEKVREQIKANPMTTISAAFAAGYMIGRKVAGKVKK